MPETHGLNPRQLSFCRNVLSGKMSNSEAYRRAGYKSESPDVEAAKLMGNASVCKYIEERQHGLEEKDIFLKAEALEVLKEIAQNTEEQGSARVSAIATAAKMLPWLEAEKLELGTTDALALVLAKARGQS